MTENNYKYFLTVDWCNKGNRGIFCSREGTAFPKDTPHTEDDIWEILDCFNMILSPKSEAITEEELKQYHRFIPLAEYSNKYGVVLK